MKFIFDKKEWNNIIEGEKNCYLMANGLGGYQSMNLIGGVARGDQALLMSAKRAPNVRRHMITGLLETLWIGENKYTLTSQRMEEEPDLEGFQHLTLFEYDGYPKWTYCIGDIRVEKTMVLCHGENTVAIQYRIVPETPDAETAEQSRVSLKVAPLLRMTAKNEEFVKEDAEQVVSAWLSETGEDVHGKVTKQEDVLYFATDGEIEAMEPTLFGPMYFSQDERDGREKSGCAMINHEVSFTFSKEKDTLTIVYSTKECNAAEGSFAEYLAKWTEHQKELLDLSGVRSELGRELVLSADAYVVDRESTKGKSILAGFPFFEDWGRDTMISIPGITLVTGRYEDCKSMLRTFAKYEKNGLLPNLFPEGTENPMYNSVDAPLLFINTVYEYVHTASDKTFIAEIFPVLKNIVDGYRKGTDFHIHMDADGLIAAGAELEQLTWMDVRVGDHLPTPRHGKPVEINAYWYSALKVMEEFSLYLKEETSDYDKLAADYAALAEQVKESFLQKFYNEDEECLKDVLSGNGEENQVRCNQIWTLTQPFTMIPSEWEEKILRKVREELYAGVGLRTLSPKDAAFHPIYIGPMEQRDRAYHQGTVWAFPLGAYFRACLHYFEEHTVVDEEWHREVADGIAGLEAWLKEGCLGHVAEIYDGETPTVSRGCYAQAWSVGELLRAVRDAERYQEKTGRSMRLADDTGREERA